MATTEPNLARPTDDEIAAAYAAGQRHAERRTRNLPFEMQEVGQDSATDAILWAIDHYDPARGSFGACAAAATRMFLARRIGQQARRHNAKPEHVELCEEAFAAPRHTTADTGRDFVLPESVRELPPDLRDAVRLFYVDRFDIRDCGLLLGIGRETVRARLQRAAELLRGECVARRDRPAGARRLLR